MVEQTVFRGTEESVIKLSSCELNVYVFVFAATYILSQVLSVYYLSFSVAVYMLRSSALLCLAAWVPIGFFPKLSSVCTLPLSSNPPATLYKGK